MSVRYILDGKTPVRVDDAIQWAQWFESSKRHVRQTGITYKVHGVREGTASISTVFLGLDHNWGTGPPVLYETMIFGVDDSEIDDYQERYCTWEEAETGHKIAIEYLFEWLHKENTIYSRTKRMIQRLIDRFRE